MKTALWKIRPARVLFFLLSPEDSSSVQTEFDQSAWRRRKTLLWMALSILGALAIGQL